MSDQPNDSAKTLNTSDAGSVGFAVPPGTPADDDPEKPFGVEERVTVISTGEPARVASVVKSPGGQFIYRVKIIDANNVVKGFAVCMQDDLKRRGMRAMKVDKPKSQAYEIGKQHARAAAYATGRTNLSPSLTEKQDYGYAWGEFMRGWREGMRIAAEGKSTKRLQTPEQLTLIVPVQRAVNALYQEYQKGRVNPQPINNILRMLARADAKQDVLPRTDRQGIPLVKKDLLRALRAAAAYNAGSQKDLATAIYALDLALTTLNQMLGGSAPPMPHIPRPAAASARKGGVKARLGDSLPPQLSPNEAATRAQTLTTMRQAFLNSYRDASQDEGYHRNNPMLQGGRNLPPLMTPEIARQKIQEFINNNSGARFGTAMPIRIGDFRTQLYTLAKQAGFAAGIRVLFGQKPVGTVNAATLVNIANTLLNAHADKVDAYIRQRQERHQKT